MNWITDLYSPSEETLREEEEKLREFLEHETPSLDKGLVDLRQKFVEEEERRRDTESKAGSILAVSGVLLTLLKFLYQDFVGVSVLVLMALLLLVSILLSLANLLPIGYLSPQSNQILEYTFDDEEEFTRQMYLKYHVHIFNNERVNEKRLQILRWSYYPLVLVVILLAGTLFSTPLGGVV